MDYIDSGFGSSLIYLEGIHLLVIEGLDRRGFVDNCFLRGVGL
jgi:hypothetical protein